MGDCSIDNILLILGISKKLLTQVNMLIGENFGQLSIENLEKLFIGKK